MGNVIRYIYGPLLLKNCRKVPTKLIDDFIIKVTRLTSDEGKMKFSSYWIVKLRNLHGIGIGAKE
jgi:hypothetical protein